ncbi:MAG: GDP-mannose 4,6-dehydratase [Chloroflexi bacterium]|nr:GDP-mannose 4,6-dehydratase [Chloroflexota bacterium]
MLITGGAGFIGSHLAEALLARGHRVTVIDNLFTGRFENIAGLRDHPRFRFAIDTITNEMVLDRLASECDVIFHLAAAVGVELIVKDPVRVIETNILGTHAVLQAANRYRKKVLIASTSEIYGKSVRVPFHEDDDRLLGSTTKARWSYSTSKAVDEFLGLAYYRQMGLPVVVFRLFNTVGPRQTGQYGMVLPRFVERALRGEPLKVYGDGQQSRCFCDVEDTVRAIVGLAECSESVGQVFNVGSTEEVSILDLARRVIQLTAAVTQQSAPAQAGRAPTATRDGGVGDEPGIVFVPYDQAYEAGFEDMRRRVPDISRIKAMIGWEPRVPLDETLRRVIAFQLAGRRAAEP